MNKLRELVITMVSLFLILFLVSCQTGQGFGRDITYIFGGEPSISTSDQTSAPSPTNQLWQTVKKSNWLVGLAIPIIALGAVAAFNGMVKLGMSAAIFGCVNLFMALATARFALWMAIFGLVGSVLTIVASILLKNKALVEIIKNVQNIKNTAKENNVDLVFQDKIKDELTIQTKPTQKLVQQIKSKMKLRGEI